MLDLMGFLLDFSSFFANRLEFWIDMVVPLVMLREQNKKESSRDSN
jgi:hypothetical protein